MSREPLIGRNKVAVALQGMIIGLNNRLGRNEDAVKRVEIREENQYAVTAARVTNYTVATLPTPSSTLVGYKAVATNGRKSGEGVGAGTGVEVICLNNGAGTYVWLRCTDYTAVQA